MKKIISLLLLLLFIYGCQSKNPEMDNYFTNWITDYEYIDNTLITLQSNKNDNNINVIANSEVALVSMENDGYKIDHYYQGNMQYFYINRYGTEKYFSVRTDEKAFEHPKDIYTSMVFNPNEVSNISFDEVREENGIECDVVKGKVGKDFVTFYFNHTTGTIEKLSYRGGSSLSFTRGLLELPTGFENATSVNADIVNEYMDEFTKLSK